MREREQERDRDRERYRDRDREKQMSGADDSFSGRGVKKMFDYKLHNI